MHWLLIIVLLFIAPIQTSPGLEDQKDDTIEVVTHVMKAIREMGYDFKTGNAQANQLLTIGIAAGL